MEIDNSILNNDFDAPMETPSKAEKEEEKEVQKNMEISPEPIHTVEPEPEEKSPMSIVSEPV